MVLYCGDPLLKVVLSKYPLQYRTPGSSSCNEISRRHSRLSSMLRILTANFYVIFPMVVCDERERKV